MNTKLMIEDLKAQPERFFEEGRAYDLLQKYFEGADILSLAELLADENSSVRKSAVWITSELGKDAVPLVECVLPLLGDAERYIRYHALEVVLVCSQAGIKGLFHHVISALEDEDLGVRELVMVLISNSSIFQFEEAIQHFSGGINRAHTEGLKLLSSNLIDLKPVDPMFNEIYGKDSIRAMYRAIFLNRYIKSTGRSVTFELGQVKDETTRMFLVDYMS